MIDRALILQAVQSFNNTTTTTTTSDRIEACRHLIRCWEAAAAAATPSILDNEDSCPPSSPPHSLEDIQFMRYASRCTVSAALVASQLDADGHSSPLENCEEDNPPLAAASKWLTSAAFQSALLLASTGDMTADFVFSQGGDPWCLFSALHLLGVAADCQGACVLSIDAEFSRLSACQVETLEMLGVLDVCSALASNVQVPEVLCCFLDQRSRGRNCDNNSTARGGRSLLKRKLFIAAATFTLPTYDPCNQLVWDAEHHLDLVTIFVQWFLSCRWKQSLATVVESLFGLVDVSFLARAVGAPWMLIDDGTAAVLCGSEEERLVDAHELADMLRDGMRK